MKKVLSIILCILLVLPLAAGCNGDVNDTEAAPTDTVTSQETVDDVPVPGEGIAVSGLRVNYEKEPSCVEGAPYFSWVILSEKRGTTQRSYRIRVASDESKLDGTDLVWDSGEVNDAKNTLVECGGSLSEAVRYYWNVTVTDNNGNSATSEPSYFTTALDGMTGAEWITESVSDIDTINFSGANWIWLLDGDTQGTVPPKTEYFRHVFNVGKKVASVYAAYTADDYGDLYVNGNKVLTVTRESGWQNAVVKDITEYIEEGENTIACSAVNGEAGYGGVLVKILIKYEDGTEKTVVSNGAWLCSDKQVSGWYSKNGADGFKKVNSVTEYGAHPWMSNVKTGKTAGSAPMLRVEFDAKDNISRALLFASAGGLYEAYLNGERANDSVLDPGRSEYNVRIMYQCHDVTNLVRSGKNALGAVLGRGWYIGAYSPYGATVPAFICKLVIDYKDGTRQTVVSDGSWKSFTDGPVTYNDIFNGETYDARKECDGWSEAGYDASAWVPASVSDAKTLGLGELVPQLSGTVRVMDRITAVSVNKIADRTFIYDFGQNLAGVVSLNLKGEKGTAVRLRHAEMLNDGSNGSDGAPGTLYTRNLRTAAATDNYILKGAPNGENYTPHFTFHGFRYIEIYGLDEAPALEDVVALVEYSDMEDTGSVTTSDTLLNALISNTYWGQRGNFLSTPTDCPQRDERMGWSGDAQIFCGTAAYNMNVKQFFDKYITDLNDCQRVDGAYPDVAPQSTRSQYGGSGNNAWGDAGVIIPWTMYIRYGDVSYLEKYYSNMKHYARYLMASSTSHIRNVSAYGDWLSIGESTPVEVTDTAYTIYVMDLMVKIANLTGKTSDAARFADEAAKYRKAWLSKYVASEGRLRYDTQTAYLVGLAFDIIPDDQKQAFADRLNEKIKRNKNRLTTGFIGCPLLLPTLCRYGHTDTAFALLQQEEYPSWKYPILQGATTIWERWNSYTKDRGFGDAGMNSFNHYSYGSVTEWIYSSLVGISPDEAAPGFTHFFLRPTCGGGLTEVSGSYESIQGLIRSAWNASDDVMKDYSCTVPANTTATLYLPAQSSSSVTEGGKPLADSEGVKIESEGDGIVVISLQSGEYSFEIK